MILRIVRIIKKEVVMAEEWIKIDNPVLPVTAISHYLASGKLPVYKAYYADRLVEHGLNGLPYDTFGSSLGVPHTLIQEWEKEQIGFKRAKELYDGFFKDYWTKRLNNCSKNDSSPILLALARNYLGIRTSDTQAGVQDETTSITIEMDRPVEEIK